MRLVRLLAITNANIYSESSICKKSIHYRAFLRVPTLKICKNSQFRGEGRKFDFAHIFMIDKLRHDKNYWIVFFGEISFYFKEICKLQIPLKSSVDAPFY